MASSEQLSPLQADLLREFFAREQRFVLTGGAALAGFHLRHRTSDDLDLFAKPPMDLVDGARTLQAAAAALGGSAESLRTYPEFQRWLVRRGAETTIVDLVIDRVPDVDQPVTSGSVRVHSLREIAANKLCALVGRGEIRDLVDVRAILQRGSDLDVMLADAERKDGGVSAATLAWLLDGVRIGPDATMPGGLTASEIETFRVELVRELRRRSAPKE